jgi:hypothetical protein
MSIESASRNTNWWGRASSIGLFVWFLYWFKNEPKTPIAQVLLWGPLALIHWFGIQAARRRFGWVYLLPLGLFWIIVIVALLGGIPSR